MRVRYANKADEATAPTCAAPARTVAPSSSIAALCAIAKTLPASIGPIKLWMTAKAFSTLNQHCHGDLRSPLYLKLDRTL